MNYEVIRRLASKTDATVIKWGHSQIFLPLFLFWTFFRSLTLFPKRRRPDVIFLGDALLSPLGLMLKKILCRPVAVITHGRDITFRFPLYRTKIGFSLRGLDLVIGVSHYTTDLCQGMRVPAKKCVTINNGVDIEDCTPSPQDREAARKWLNERRKPPSPYPLPLEGEGNIAAPATTVETRSLEHNRPIIITVGRLVKRKGIEQFVRGALPLLIAAHPSVLYIVAGDGKERRSIESAIRELGLSGNVLLAGSIPRNVIRGLMGISKVFVMPNIPVPGDVEGFGLVALEASCAGLPVIASDLEGIRDAVANGENGFLLPHDKPRLFVDTITSLLKNERERREIGERAKKFVAINCTWDKCAGRYLEELERLVASS
ncbi:MAG: glycosyltransferase family 4 protein [Candidatus Aureabacteria bacterium]|nr:glycosyltransferase family 4 protein [Candidatus Auribacterota bacterium]